MNSTIFSRFVCLLCATILPLHILAQTATPSPIGEIPFTLMDDSRIYVTAFVNGSDSLRFVVDTGASTVTLNTHSPKLCGLIRNEETTENVGTTGTSQITISHSNHIKVGTVEYARATCANIPFGDSDRWDGVFGLNALRAFNVEINYDGRTIYVYTKKEPLAAHRLQTKNHLPKAQTNCSTRRSMSFWGGNRNERTRLVAYSRSPVEFLYTKLHPFQVMKI